MIIASYIRFIIVAIAPALLLVTTELAATATENNYQVVNGVAIYLGVIPEEMIKDHVPNHPEARMHNGQKESLRQQHVMVALFDTANGARITDARIITRVELPGHLMVSEKELETMIIGNSVTYGNYFEMVDPGPYFITFRVSAPTLQRHIEATFIYRNR